MSILTETLPTKIKVKDKIFDINYDYRTIIRVIQAMEDNNLTYSEKMYVMIGNIYKEQVPEDYLEEACKQAIKFIDLGKDESNREETTRIYSFSKDANYIYSGINSTHHIDLELNPDLHWWKFMALFMDMDNECTFSELVYYRKRKADGKLTKEEKENYKKMKEILELDEVKKPSKAKQEFYQKLKEREVQNGKK